MEEKLGWFPHSAFATWAAPFEDKYQMVDMIMVGDTAFSKNKTRKQEGRHCIFCNKSYTETTFKTAAHLMSRMIGNTNLFSTFECDKCNNLFSKLETDVASFLGVGRSITGMSEERKTPGYPGIDLNAKSIVFNNKKLLVIHKENAERNVKEGTTKLKYQKASYTPANVYKLFLKCILSILPNDEVVNDFQLALQHLKGGTVLGGAHINVFCFPLTVNMPLHVYLFKRKSSKDKLPSYVASFYFYNFVVNVPILLHREDVQNFNQTIQVPVAPPYFVHGCDVDTIVPTFKTHNLSSPVKLKYEPEELTMQFNKEDLETATKFDPKTGEETQGLYDPAGSKYFIQTGTGTHFTKDELPELIKFIQKEFAEEV
jgi:hypothetical protein